jgi:hypothetical protein
MHCAPCIGQPPDHATSANLQRDRFRPYGRFVAKTRLRLFATRRMETRPLFLLEFRGGPRVINPDQSVKPSYKKGMALSKRCCFFGMVTPNPHARQNSPIRVNSNCKPDRRRGYCGAANWRLRELLRGVTPKLRMTRPAPTRERELTGNKGGLFCLRSEGILGADGLRGCLDDGRATGCGTGLSILHQGLRFRRRPRRLQFFQPATVPGDRLRPGRLLRGKSYFNAKAELQPDRTRQSQRRY